MKVLAVIPGKKGQKRVMGFAGRQNKVLRELGVEVFEYYLENRTLNFASMKEIFNIRKIIKKNNIDIIHAHYGSFTSMISFLAGFGIKKVVTFVGDDLSMRNKGTPFLKKLLAYLMSHVSIFLSSLPVCVGEQMKRQMKIRSFDAISIVHGVDLDVFFPMDKTECRTKLSLPVDKKILLFNISGDPEVKRLDIAEKVSDYINEKLEDFYFLTLSGGIDPQDMPLYINSADCLLMTSDSEGSPIIILESLACNTPIVSNDVGNVREMISGVSNSFVLERDVSMMGDKIISILEKQVRSNGRDVRDRYCLKESTDRLKTAYLSLG